MNYKESLEITKKLGDLLSERDTLLSLGNVYTNHFYLSEALQTYHTCLHINRKLIDRRGEGDMLWNIGNIHFD